MTAKTPKTYNTDNCRFIIRLTLSWLIHIFGCLSVIIGSLLITFGILYFAGYHTEILFTYFTGISFKTNTADRIVLGFLANILIAAVVGVCILIKKNLRSSYDKWFDTQKDLILQHQKDDYTFPLELGELDIIENGDAKSIWDTIPEIVKIKRWFSYGSFQLYLLQCLKSLAYYTIITAALLMLMWDIGYMVMPEFKISANEKYPKFVSFGYALVQIYTGALILIALVGFFFLLKAWIFDSCQKEWHRHQSRKSR